MSYSIEKSNPDLKVNLNEDSKNLHFIKKSFSDSVNKLTENGKVMSAIGLCNSQYALINSVETICKDDIFFKDESTFLIIKGTLNWFKKTFHL